MSVEISAKVWEYSKHKGSHLLLLVSLADYANKEGWAWPSIKSLCERTRLGERYVQKMLQEIADSGEIEIHPRPGHSSCYRVGVNYSSGVNRGSGVNSDSQRGEPGFGGGVKRDAPNPSKNHQEPPSLSRKERGSLDEIKGFCKEIGLTDQDAEYCFNHWESSGWKRAGKKILCWKSVIRAWKLQSYLPSQKNRVGRSSKSTDRDYSITSFADCK